MEDFLDGLDCKLRMSGMVADSLMMGIVNTAMEQAFEKACSKEGIIERLNEKSRFCELAVMQLEWCLKFVQEETDNYVVVESIREREKLVSDLTETRDRIRRRLEETELAILGKDKELCERFESEMKLRQALEVKDRELSSLQTNLEISNRVSGDDGTDGDFCELKNSVDQQFFNIKQKLEDERMNYTKRTSSANVEFDLQVMEEGKGSPHDVKEIEFYGSDCNVEVQSSSARPELNAGFEKMGSDIDILKETLDLAFGLMGNAIRLSEVAPMEQQWRGTVEKDTMSVVFRGFLRDVQQDIELKIKEGKKVSLGENRFQLMDEITSLRNELETLVNQVEDRAKSVSSSTVTSSATSPTDKDAGGKVILQKLNWSKEKPPLDVRSVASAVDRCGKLEDMSLKVKEQDNVEEPAKVDSSGQGSLVAEMIRNHESIIRQKSEELNWLKGEILKERGCSSVKKDRNTINKRIKDLIVRLDGIIKGNVTSLATSHDECGFARGNDSNDKDLNEEVRKLKQEREDLNMKTVIMEDVNSVTFKNLVKDMELELYKYDITNLIREDVCNAYLKEMAKEWNDAIVTCDFESHIRDEIYQSVLNEAVKDAYGGLGITECQAESNEDNFVEDSPAADNSYQNLEGLIREDVQTVFLCEMVQEWKKSVDSFNIVNNVKEEVVQTVFREAMRYNNDNIQSFTSDLLEGLTEEDVQTVFLREMVQEWNKSVDSFNIVNNVKEEVDQTVFHEAMRCNNDSIQSFTSDLLEDLIREDVQTVFLREMVQEWNKSVDSFNVANNVKKEVFHTVIREAMIHNNDCIQSFTSDLLDGLIREDVQTVFLHEMVQEWDISVEAFNILNHVKEDVLHTVIRESFISSLLEGLIREDVQRIFLRGMVQEWDSSVENFNIVNHIREEVLHTVFHEAMRYNDYHTSFTTGECHETRTEGNVVEEPASLEGLVQDLEDGIRDDVCTVLLREMVKEWEKEIEDYNIEILIREDIYYFVFLEGVKDITVRTAELGEVKNQENFRRDSPCANDVCQSVHVGEKSILMQTLESISNCSEFEEDLPSGASPERVEQNGKSSIVVVEHENLGNRKIHCEGMLVQKDADLGCTNNKLQLQETTVEDFNNAHVHMTTVKDREVSLCKMEKNNGVIEHCQFNSLLIPISEFSKAIGEFDCVIQEKLGQNIWRFEEVKHLLDASVKHVASIRKKELLYRKAFLCRCYNLQKAEAEVDLLGDEVDALLVLLEKIYVTLNHYSPFLQHNVEECELISVMGHGYLHSIDFVQIMGVLDLIRKELNVPVVHTFC